MRERQERENLSFALLMVLVSAQTLVEGTAMYLAKYSLSANETLMPLWSDIQSVARRVKSASLRKRPKCRVVAK